MSLPGEEIPCDESVSLFFSFEVRRDIGLCKESAPLCFLNFFLNL
jgi:hypothetical protein